MSAAVSAAVAASTAASASAASARASREKDEACQIILENYNPKTTSVDGMHTYVECVERMHPAPVQVGVSMEQVCFIFAVLSVIVGGILGFTSSDRHNRTEDVVLGSMLGFIVALAVIVLSVITYAVWF